MSIVITPGRDKEGRIYALVRFCQPGQPVRWRTVRLHPDEVAMWDERVTAFILARDPSAREWQGVLW